MTTKLDKPLRREVVIGREPWVATITPTATGLKLTRKGRRKGLEFGWDALVSGDAALAVALNASLRETRRTEPVRFEEPRRKRLKPRAVRKRSR